MKALSVIWQLLFFIHNREVGVWTLLEQRSPSRDAGDLKVLRFWLTAGLASGLQLVCHQIHTNQAESPALWVCVCVFISKKDCLTPDLFPTAGSCAMCVQSVVNCPPCRSPDRQCHHCPDGWRVAGCSVLLCRTRSKSLLSLSKLIFVKPVHIYCWLH